MNIQITEKLRYQASPFIEKKEKNPFIPISENIATVAFFLGVSSQEVISVISYQLSVESEPPTKVGGLKY